jgi:hypothetical protein
MPEDVMEHRKQNAPKPPPLPPVAAEIPAPELRGGELTDEDLEFVVGGVSLEAHQFLESGLGSSHEE